MFSHVTIGSNDLARSVVFYDALLAPLGIKRRKSAEDVGSATQCWVQAGGSIPGFYVGAPFDGRAATGGNGSMAAFVAADPAAVDAAYLAGIAAGGTDEGRPGPRPQYGRGYYGAYLRDPDGNKVHIVHRGDV